MPGSVYDIMLSMDWHVRPAFARVEEGEKRKQWYEKES